MKRTSVLVFLVAVTAACVVAGFGATAAKAVSFCQGAACGPSGPQGVTPTNAAGNVHCPAGTTEIAFAITDIQNGGTVSKPYSFGGQSGNVTLNVDLNLPGVSFSISGGALAQQVNIHGGNGNGGVNSTNMYNYSAKTGGGVTADGSTSELRFPGPISNVFVCLVNGPVLAVTTSSFHASYTGRAVTVRWRTSSEANVLGFNVYRLSHGKRVKLNKRLIPSANVLHGKSTSAYSFRTRLASKRLAASSRYLLQEVHVNGSKSVYGPIRARNAA